MHPYIMLPLTYIALQGDEPHKNFYLVHTHHQFLMEMTVKPILDSRRICKQLRAELSPNVAIHQRAKDWFTFSTR